MEEYMTWVTVRCRVHLCSRVLEEHSRQNMYKFSGNFKCFKLLKKQVELWGSSLAVAYAWRWPLELQEVNAELSLHRLIYKKLSKTVDIWSDQGQASCCNLAPKGNLFAHLEKKFRLPPPHISSGTSWFQSTDISVDIIFVFIRSWFQHIRRRRSEKKLP